MAGISLEEWQTKGYGTNFIVVDPLLKDPDNYDFSLKIHIKSNRQLKLKLFSLGIYEINMKKGDENLLYIPITIKGKSTMRIVMMVSLGILVCTCAVTQAEDKLEATVKSLENYRCPEWFRNAKFGIYCHWNAQSASKISANGWYAQNISKME